MTNNHKTDYHTHYFRVMATCAASKFVAVDSGTAAISVLTLDVLDVVDMPIKEILATALYRLKDGHPSMGIDLQGRPTLDGVSLPEFGFGLHWTVTAVHKALHSRLREAMSGEAKTVTCDYWVFAGMAVFIGNPVEDWIACHKRLVTIYDVAESINVTS